MPPRHSPIRSILAQFLKACLPLLAERVTRHAMLLIAAAIASALPLDDSSPSSRPIVQARAAIRIVSAARIQWDQQASGGEIPRARETVVQTTDGPKAAKLIEFE